MDGIDAIRGVMSPDETYLQGKGEKSWLDYIVHLHMPPRILRLETVATCKAEREVREVNVNERAENYECSEGRRRRSRSRRPTRCSGLNGGNIEGE